MFGKTVSVILAISLLAIMGCSSVEDAHTFTFKDGKKIEVRSVEEHTSPLNVQMVTVAEDPDTKSTQVFVNGGISVGKAGLDVLNSAAQLGAGALIGYGLGYPQASPVIVQGVQLPAKP